MAIKIESASGNFTALAGLTLYSKIYDRLKIRDDISDYLPSVRGGRVLKRDKQKFKNMILGFIAGAECLDDMKVFAQDPGFVAVCKDKTFEPITYGNFLRGFASKAIFHLNECLIKMAIKLRLALFREDKDFVLDIDSTHHVQYGKKMEGLGFNYDKKWGLDSIQAFDQHGFQYWMEVRPGGTFTANGAAAIIDRVFRRVPRKMNRFMRGDSGYCNFDVFKACQDKNVKFVITMRQNMLDTVMHHKLNWKPAKELVFRDGRSCEIASTVYYSGHYKASLLRVVIIRARKTQKDLFDTDGYDYRAWVTNLGEHEMKNEDVILFYQKRGNAENFIRELKNGFDLQHFPCQQLKANKVYGIIAAMSHNLMRFTAWNIDGKIPKFSKALRFKMVYIAGQVVRKARTTIFRLAHPFRKEVEHRITTIQKAKFGLASSA